MKAYLEDLINRMVDKTPPTKGPPFSSADTISWKAHREAETLAEQNFIPELIEFIKGEKDKERRGSAYFALSHLSKNISDESAVQFMIDRVERETSKYVIASLLDGIERMSKPAGTNLEPIFRAMIRKEWLIRYSAIQALKRSADQAAEDKLIEVLETSNDPHDLAYSNATLNKIGTPRSIPHLEQQATSRKRDVKISAQLAIESIRAQHAKQRNDP